MRVVFNTNYKAAGTRVCVDDLSRRMKEAGHQTAFNDWDHYQNYDLALFMAPDSKVREAKEKNPGIICGLMDPKAQRPWQFAEARAADFLLVSSIEQRDFFLKYNPNIFIYYMFPLTPEFPKKHEDKGKIAIGYHGNKLHLHSMKEVAAALDKLSEKYKIEFRAIYNIEKLGIWRKNAPRRCPVRHIQWEEESQLEHLKECDIGIVPSKISLPPWSRFLSRFPSSVIANWMGYNKNDYLLRFKYSTNPGGSTFFPSCAFRWSPIWCPRPAR